MPNTMPISVCYHIEPVPKSIIAKHAPLIHHCAPSRFVVLCGSRPKDRTGLCVLEYAVNLPSRARVRASIVTACVWGGRIPRHGQRIHLQCGAWTRGLDRARAKKTSWVVGKGLTSCIRFICYATVLAKVSTSHPSLLTLKRKASSMP